MCGYHMVSEASAPRFVFRSRVSPVCPSECVKIQFHIQGEEPETEMLTVDSRVFDVCDQRSCVSSRIRVKASLLDDNQVQYPKCE